LPQQITPLRFPTDELDGISLVWIKLKHLRGKVLAEFSHLVLHHTLLHRNSNVLAFPGMGVFIVFSALDQILKETSALARHELAQGSDSTCSLLQRSIRQVGLAVASK
jgi:hypothetical protein